MFLIFFINMFSNIFHKYVCFIEGFSSDYFLFKSDESVSGIQDAPLFLGISGMGEGGGA